MNDTTQETIHRFPCDYVLKIMGLANDEFEITVLSIIRKHVPDLKENAIKTRLSKDKKYMSMSVTIYAQSKEHLDAIYQELTSSKVVLFAL